VTLPVDRKARDEVGHHRPSALAEPSLAKQLEVSVRELSALILRLRREHRHAWAEEITTIRDRLVRAGRHILDETLPPR
jgi:hypothetical protein